MSLSQKHAGKVLVPWFSVAEWKAVYNLIYTENTRNWPKALEVLKIWKIRTPLLSAGVEGTLIVLEALLVDTNKLSSYEVTHIFATSLVRFLNLCAAYSEKQGTFYKTAKKNGLPKWLINLRHDIAHSHNVPPQSMLEMSLKFCLEWLQENYWDVQESCMCDFVVSNVDDGVVDDAIYIYTNLSESVIVGKNKKLMACVRRYVKNNNKMHMSSSRIVDIVLEALRKAIISNPQGVCDRICKLLIDDCVILPTELDSDSTGKEFSQPLIGKKRIAQDFLSKWNKLLNIIHQTQIMSYFVSHLFRFICDEKHDWSLREAASLWIYEIFQGLCNSNKNHKETGYLVFTSNNSSVKSKSFVNEVLYKPTKFTLNFVQEVLQYNDAPPEFIEDSVTLLSAFNFSGLIKTNGILTVKDLNLDIDDDDTNLHLPTPAQAKHKWVLIEDTSSFANVPLGVLPHQDRNINPLLDL